MTYTGNKIPAKEAQVYMDRAFLYLKNITLGRIEAVKGHEDIITTVSAVAEVFYAFSEQGNAKTENNDGYSVTYKDSSVMCEAYRVAAELLPPYLLCRNMEVVNGC